MSRQEVLAIEVAHQPTLTNYVAGANTELVSALQDSQSGFCGYWVFGDDVCGKTHLLRATCLAGAESGHLNAYVDCADQSPNRVADTLLALASTVRDGMDFSATVAVDHVSHLSQQRQAEEALMAVYNALSELPPQGSTVRRLLVAHRHSAGQTAFALPDLNSRMRSLAHHRPQELSDADKGLLLRQRAEQSGYHLSEAVLEYWLRRGPRGMDRLLADLARLDQATLEHKRLLTVPLLKSVLGY